MAGEGRRVLAVPGIDRELSADGGLVPRDEEEVIVSTAKEREVASNGAVLKRREIIPLPSVDADAAGKVQIIEREGVAPGAKGGVDRIHRAGEIENGRRHPARPQLELGRIGGTEAERFRTG